MRKHGLLWLAALLVAALVVIAYCRSLPHALSDPDRYFHIRLAQLMQEKGTVHELPQVEDLGWGDFFPDKEFLFHVLTGRAYAFFGEGGVAAVPPLLTLATLLSLIFVGSRFVSWPVATLFTLLLLGTNIHFFGRLILLRPHLLAMLEFVWISYAFLTETAWLAAIFMLLFALTYHAVFMPLLVILAYVCAALASKRPFSRMTGYAFTGLVAGCVLNPFFPSNILMGLQHVRIAFRQDPIPIEYFGTELHALQSSVYIKVFGCQLALLALLAGIVVRAWPQEDRALGEGKWQGIFLLGLLAACLGLTFLNPRADEYSALVTAISICYVLAQKVPRRTLPALLVVILAGQGASAVEFFRTGSDRLHSQKQRQDTLAALASLPESSKGAKVFNCNWSDSPYIFYERPDLRFVDILDPSFLYISNKALFANRYGILDGKLPDFYAVMRDQFNADFVLCDRPDVPFEADPNFVRLFPRDKAGATVLYAVRPERVSAQVQSFSLGFWPKNTLSPTTEASSSPQMAPWEGEATGKKARIMFVDLIKEYRERTGGTDLNPAPKVTAEASQDSTQSAEGAEQKADFCARLAPSETEVSRLLGAEVMTIGGGPHIRMYLNGQRVFVSSVPFARAFMHAAVVNLPRPLAKGDQLEAVVCTTTGDSFYGFSLALWRKAELAALCQEKGAADFFKPAADGDWLANNKPGSYCLAPEARSIKR